MKARPVVMALPCLIDTTGKVKEVFMQRALSCSVFVMGLRTCEAGATERREELQFIFSAPSLSQSGAS